MESIHQQERDAQTAQLLRRGEAEGLKRLLVDHARAVSIRLRRDFANAMTETDVEEAMSLASLRAWNAARRIDAAKGSLRAWLLVIARRCVLRMLDSRRREDLRLDANLDRQVAGTTWRAPVPGRQARLLADLRRCIERLPPLQRAVLTADLEADGIAAARPLAAQHNTSTNSIYVTRLKARKAVRLALAALGYWFALPQERDSGSLEQSNGNGGNNEVELDE